MANLALHGELPRAGRLRACTHRLAQGMGHDSKCRDSWFHRKSLYSAIVSERDSSYLFRLDCVRFLVIVRRPRDNTYRCNLHRRLQLQVAIGRCGFSKASPRLLAGLHARYLAGVYTLPKTAVEAPLTSPQSFGFGRPPSINLAFVDCEIPTGEEITTISGTRWRTDCECLSLRPRR